MFNLIISYYVHLGSFICRNLFFEACEIRKEGKSKSSPPEVFLRRGVLKIWSKFTGEHPCQSVILMKLQSSFIEITLRHECFPVNLLNISGHPFIRTSQEGCFCKSFKGLKKLLKQLLAEIHDNEFFCKYVMVLWHFLKYSFSTVLKK